MFNNTATGSSVPGSKADSDSEALVDLSTSPEQDNERDTTGSHGSDGGSSEGHSKAASQTLGDEDSSSSLGV